MKKAIIGHSGFVGSNLLQQQHFDCCFNSKNISEIDHQQFDFLICSGVSAVKWWANQNPEQDRIGIQNLIKHLKTIKVKEFILISTIDVYPNPVDVDESTIIDINQCHPYGKHRLELEQWARETFDATVIRLPGLFGAGLKKNIIYDFLNDNNVEQINPNGAFQFYYLDHLSDDIAKAINQGIKLLNISTEAITVQEVAKVCLGHELDQSSESKGALYDYKSQYAELLGGANGYLYDRNAVIADLKKYVNASNSQPDQQH